MIAVLALLTLGATPAPKTPALTHDAADRQAQLKAAIDALRAAPPADLEAAHQYAAVFERGSCSSPVQRLRVECLMTAAKKWCQKKSRAEQPACASVMDVVVSNVMAERQLVPTDKRYEIMKRAKDWRREVNREIRRQQGTLAVDYRLRMGDADDAAALAKGIDQFCLSTADESGLSWQICAASLAWFIATDGGGR